MKILVPLDGTPLSESVIPCATGLAQRWGAELVAVRVVDPILPVTPDLPASLVDRLREQALAEASHYAPPNLAARLLLPVGKAPEQIAQAALQEGCQVIVMASHGHSGATRWLLGSVAERVLRQAHCPVLLLRPPAPVTSQFQHILVAVDGSQASLQVAHQLGPYLAPSGIVTLLQVSSLARYQHLPGFPPGQAKLYLAELEQKLLQIKVTGLDLRVQVLEGALASAAIINWAEENRCDLIAMSTHGRTGFRRFWLGSVTEKVARHSHCPLLALRFDESAYHQTPPAAPNPGP